MDGGTDVFYGISFLFACVQREVRFDSLYYNCVDYKTTHNSHKNIPLHTHPGGELFGTM